ncbi:MAG: glycosyl transferase family 2 [Clostridiales bacterium]|nr:glycosyl transferase family 2 [Clostridiales bacterium]
MRGLYHAKTEVFILYKVCVYAISKNESAFARRWMESMREADWVCVLDTGSTDDTVSVLRSLGAHVETAVIDPWRFDAARNASMALIPKEADICVCTDLDEIFHPGWRKALERSWSDKTTQARYRYTWNFLADGSEGVVFFPEKIHKNGVFRWIHPVHEVLEYIGNKPQHIITCPEIQLDHRADPNKSRSQYLPLLELSVSENPEDDRGMHYLGREYLFYGRWADCIRTLKQHLSLPRATWADERCASMRYIAQAEEALDHPDEALRWLHRAVAEAPHLREPWVEAAQFLFRQQDWNGVIYMARRALSIQSRPSSYICSADAWGSLPWDLAAVALYHLNRFDESAQMAEKALSFEPQNDRIRENLRLIRMHTS